MFRSADWRASANPSLFRFRTNRRGQSTFRAVTGNANFTFKAKGKLWDGKPGKVGKPDGGDGAVKYKEEFSTKPPTHIDLEGTCDPRATARKRTFTVSQLFIVTYPADLVAAIKDAKAEKPKKVVEVGEISGSITWTVTAKDCKSKFLLVVGNKTTEPGGALVTQFVIPGGTY